MSSEKTKITKPARSVKKAIEDMDFQELRKEVQELSDAFLQMQRRYEDLLYNLDNENFSITLLSEKDKLIKEKDDMKTEIDITAEGLKAEIARGDEQQTLIEANAEGIKTKVSKVMSYGEADKGDYDPTLQPPPDTDKLYFWEDKKKYYYFNEISKKWVEMHDTSIYSAFIQTADGFEFSGLVKINGDLITEGTITGTSIETAKTKFGDGVVLDAENARIEIWYGKKRIGSWGICDSPVIGSAITPVNGAGLVIRDPIFMGDCDFSRCDTLGGLKHNHGIPDGTWLMTADGGSIEWSEYDKE